MRLALLLLALVALGACRADEVRITVTGPDLQAAAAGEVRSLPFTAWFSQPGTLEAEARAELATLEAAARAHMAIEGFEVVQAGEDWTVTVTGRLPLAGPGAAPGDAWMLRLGPPPAGIATLAAWPLALALEPTPGYDAMIAAMGAADETLRPDRLQPVTLVLEARGAPFDLLALAATVDGAPALVRELARPEAASVTFAADLFELVPPTIYLRPAG
jgi:hypothetical protein